MGVCCSTENDDSSVPVNLASIRSKIREKTNMDDFARKRIRFTKRELFCVVTNVKNAIDDKDDDLLVACLDIAAVCMLKPSDFYQIDSDEISVFCARVMNAISPLRLHKLEFSNVSNIGKYMRVH